MFVWRSLVPFILAWLQAEYDLHSAREVRRIHKINKSIYSSINTMSEREAKKLAAKLNTLFEGIYSVANSAGKPIYVDFQKLPSRTGTDYYKYITRPISLHTIGRNIKKFTYKDGQGFVDDLAQITWNARHYNEPASEIYENALLLDNYIKDTVIPRLSTDPKVPNSSTLYYPDLGPLEEYGHNTFDEEGASASPYVKNEDYDEDEQSMVNYGYSSRTSMGSAKPGEGGVRRGRPPIIDRPYESRIKSILKLIKKIRHPEDENHILTSHFERLPDKSLVDYYKIIDNPISLHEIRAKVRSRKYSTVQQFLDDMSLMISNAKIYNASNPEMINEVILFEREAEQIITKEMLRPESDFMVSAAAGSDSLKTPLDQVTVRNHTYKVGDWVLIRNANDINKPICGQIFRLWTADGIQYTNVCWYIRPEQTCHRDDRLFYINEVCKTGEYRDHLAEDILAPCYVIFLTYYQKGDIPPNLLPEGTEWFICEFRYNVNTYAFNRIRTWKACLPDEIRHIDQPIVPINEPRKLVKYDSPIKDLLPNDAQGNLAPVSPVPGPNANGPPIVGAVYRKPPYYNDELGQCSTSPNVVRAPELDDHTTGRKAYIFTPASQLKIVAGSGIYSSSGTRSVPANYTPSQADEYSLNNSPSAESLAYKTSYPPVTPQPMGTTPMAYPPTSVYKPYINKAHIRDYSTSASVRGTPPASYSVPLSGGLSSTPSIYSNVLIGGVVSYVGKKPTAEEEDVDEPEQFEDVSKLLVSLAGSPVWFRAPPVLISEKLLTPIGHSAKYLAWKLKKNQA